MGEKKCPPCKKGAPEYMNTYGDMMTLLLCFFVLLFAFSSMDSQKFQTIMKAFKGSMGVMKGGKTVSPEQLITNTRIQSKGTELKFKKLAKEIQEELDKLEKDKKIKDGEEDKALEETATVKITQRGIEISLGDRTLFDLGKAELKDEAKNILKIVYDKLKGMENDIIIEGHTDNVPINTTRFPSNWELSTTRATNVLRFLLSQDNSLRGRISAAGYAETKPLTSNETNGGRRKNRRVDIVILESSDNKI